MKCPACVNDLTEKMVDNILVVVCDGGCGGIWFDLYELKKVDETHAAKGRDLLHVRRDENVRADHTARRMCPRCYGTMMMRHFHSSKRNVEVDECPKCGDVGYNSRQLHSNFDVFDFLDSIGELEHLELLPRITAGFR